MELLQGWTMNIYLLCISFLHHGCKFVRDQQLRRKERKLVGQRKSCEANVKPVATQQGTLEAISLGPKRPGHYTDTCCHWAQTSLERHGLKSLLDMQMYHPDPRSKTLSQEAALCQFCSGSRLWKPRGHLLNPRGGCRWGPYCFHRRVGFCRGSPQFLLT